MSLFKWELKESETKHMFDVVQIADPPKIKIIGKERERRVSKAVTDRWLDLLTTLHYDDIRGNSFETFAYVKKIILKHSLEDRVLPIQCVPPKEKIVRMFSKNQSYIEMVRNAYDNPDPWADNFSTNPFFLNSKRPQKDNNVASLKRFDGDIRLKFITHERIGYESIKKTDYKIKC